MGPVVCATRGGEASRRTQERAVALAKERGARLIFLCVVDPDFAAQKDEALKEAVRGELRRLARSLLSIAKTRAREQGVEAETAVRFGPVWPTIEGFLQEVGAATLVIGAPRAGDEPTSAAGIEQFVEEVRQTTGAEVVVA